MTGNFNFLKKIDKNLYTIINEAEELYRAEFFEQCMVQTRRFGEHICKNVLGDRIRTERTFDDMLATLKDKITGDEQEKEFIEDLYFLKKHGNSSAHSITVHKDGIEALECLQRAFEAAINYCVFAKGGSQNILKLSYDTELLITGKRMSKTLSDKYVEVKQKTKDTCKNKNKKSSIQKKTTKSQSYKMTTSPKRNGITAFWLFVSISFIVSTTILLFMMLL